jgi:hypothetical protein
LIAVGLAFAEQPTIRHPLTAKEATALQEPAALGHRMLSALSRYSQASESLKVPPEFDVLTRLPTIEVLHAVGFISDSDMRLTRRYQPALLPIPPNAAPTQPLLTLETDRGELIFDTRGNVTLRRHQ